MDGTGGEKVKVSIITIVFNNREHIADCIQSVINQTYQNIEYIVVDGGSTDGTREVIDSFKGQIADYLSEPDEGLYDGLNKGIKLATGDIVGILHSDDLFYNNYVIEDVIKTFVSESPDIVYGNGIFVDRNDVEKVRRIYSSSAFRKSYLKFGWIPLHTTIFVKRSLFEELGYYSLEYSVASDYDISLRWFFSDNLKKVFLNRILVKMRLGGKSTSLALQKKKSQEDLEIINNYHLMGTITLIFKIVRKIPQYLKPVFCRSF
jgi:glycosyltransferase